VTARKRFPGPCDYPIDHTFPSISGLGRRGVVSMKTFIACLLTIHLLGPSSTTAAIEWQTNDDEMTGERRATIVITEDEYGSTARLAVRIDSPETVWLLYHPGRSVPDTEGTMLLKFDDEEPLWQYAEDVNLQDFWLLRDIDPAIEKAMIETMFVQHAMVRVQIRTESVQAGVDRFSLMGFTRAYDAAMEHVRRETRRW
jgi:hypothetical protein